MADISGRGTGIFGDLTNTGGSLYIGDEPEGTGNLGVFGDFTQNSGTLYMQIVAFGGNDVLDVVGLATLGGTLSLSVLGEDIPSYEYCWTLITYDTVTGSFTVVPPPLYYGTANYGSGYPNEDEYSFWLTMP